VHGICDDTSIWDTFEQTLIDSGFVVERLVYGTPDFSLRPSDYVPDLRTWLNSMGAGHVTVVAHSMGGLISRKYIEEQSVADQPNKISKLVTLGTPHHGSDFGRWMLRFYFGVLQGVVGAMPNQTAMVFELLKRYTKCQADPRSIPAAFDMLPASEFLNELNYGANRGLDDPPGSHGWDAHRNETTLPQDAEIATIGGTATFCTWRRVGAWIWGRGPTYHDNDAVVATNSALMANPAAAPDRDVDLVGSHLTHAELFFTCGATYLNSTALARKTAGILLRGQPPSEPHQPLAPAATGGLLGAEETQDDSMRVAPAIVDTTSPGRVALRSVALPVTTAADIMLMSTDAILTLETPSGTILTPGDTSTVPGLEYYGDPGSGFEGFHIDHPAAGTWSVHVDATHSSDLQTFVIVAEHASPYLAGVSVANSQLYAGDTLQFSAVVSTGGSPVASASWACHLRRPDGALEPVGVFDDGAHGDGSAGDGVFGAAFVPGAGLGDYQVVGTATLLTGESLVAGTVARLARFADLAVDSLDIVLSKNLVVAGDSVSVSATVHNHGPDAAMGVTVTVTDRQTFEELGRDTVDIPAGGSASVQVPWHVAAPNAHRIQVSIAPLASPAEVSLANNSAVRTVVLGYPVGVRETVPASARLVLRAPRPNPSHGTVTLTFSLPRNEAVTLVLFDILGRRVRRWEWRQLGAGVHFVEWDGTTETGTRLPAGVFLCRLRAGGEVQSQKMIVR